MCFIKEFLGNERKELEGNSSHNAKAHPLLHAHSSPLQKPNSVQPVCPDRDVGGGGGVWDDGQEAASEVQLQALDLMAVRSWARY